jgi:hypothetical protein
MVWFGHDPDLNGSESDREEDAWSAGEWEGPIKIGDPRFAARLLTSIRGLLRMQR